MVELELKIGKEVIGTHRYISCLLRLPFVGLSTLCPVAAFVLLISEVMKYSRQGNDQ